MQRTGMKSTKTLETRGGINLLSEQQDKQTKAHGHKGWARQMAYMAFSPPRQETSQFANKSKTLLKYPFG